jgi:putative endonuclease
MQGAWLYIITNRPNGILYIGTTTDLIRRIWEHREDVSPGFARKYGLNRLVYYEHHETLQTARQRELNIKHWSRAWKARLILEFNPFWADLYDSLH